MTYTIFMGSVNIMSMKRFEGNIKSITDTPFGYTLTMIGGKWRLVILYWLVEHGVVRFNELQRLIGGITYKTLSAQLKGNGSGWSYYPDRVSANPSQGGIQTFRQKANPCTQSWKQCVHGVKKISKGSYPPAGWACIM